MDTNGLFKFSTPDHGLQNLTSSSSRCRLSRPLSACASGFLSLISFLLLLPLGASASDSQELVVSNCGYYLNGEQEQEISEFDARFNPAEPVIVKACASADTTRLVVVLDWLTEKGKGEIMVSTVRQGEEEFCEECK